MNIEGMQVYFASDLKDYGYTEDGTKFIGESFYIEVENDRGDRWRLGRMFDGVRVVHEEDGTMYYDERARVRARCEYLVAKIQYSRKIDLTYWNEARPAYGSQAYIEYGRADDLALERMEG